MPHNLFLHTSIIQSRKINRTSKSKTREALWFLSMDTGLSLLLSFFINMAVVCLFAMSSQSCNKLSVMIRISDAAMPECLQRLGSWVPYVWAMGLLAAGQVRVAL